MNKLNFPFFALITIFLINSCDSTSGSGSQQYSDIQTLVTQVKMEINELPPDRLHQMIEEGEMFTLIDVRTREEHDIGYIPGSVTLSRGLLEFNISKDTFWEEEGLYTPLKDELIILYCRSGNRSALSAKSLMNLGYTNVFSLQEGFNVWKEIYPEMTEFNLPAIDPSLLGPAAEDDSGGSC